MRSPLPTPATSRAAETLASRAARKSSAPEHTTPPVILLPGPDAATGESQNVPEAEITDPVTNTGTSAADRDDNSGVQAMDTETDKTEAAVASDLPQPAQQQQQQQPPPPVQPAAAAITTTATAPSAPSSQLPRKQAPPPKPTLTPQHQKSTAPSVSGKAPANTDRRVIVPPGKDVSAPSTQQRGFVQLQTQSGQSLGSLKSYAMDWNAADTSEVSPTQRQLHPAAPGNVSRLMYDARLALQKADKAAAVNILCPISFISY